LAQDVIRNRIIPVILGISYGVGLRVLLAADIDIFAGLVSFSFFVFVPFAIGFIVVYIDSEVGRRGRGQHFFAPWLAIVAFLLTTMVLMLEGSICALIVSPGFLILAGVGGLAAGWFRKRQSIRSSTLSVVLLLPIVLSPLEAHLPASAEIKTRVDSVVIDADAATIWRNISFVDRIDESELTYGVTRLLGVPRPLEAHMGGSNGEQVRYTKWEKGISFQERIVEWSENSSMQWEFEFPPGSIPKGTLDDHVAIGGEYFDLVGGGYTLTPQESGKVQLTLTTSYRVSARPKLYSLVWADVVMGDFHRMILSLVADRSESKES
jgi:hypothetical protein